MIDVKPIELSDYDRGRLEMAIDCEGNISLGKNKNKTSMNRWSFKPLVMVVNTNIKLLEVLIDISGGLGKIVLTKKQKGNYKACYYWWLRSSEQRVILPQLSLIIKEGQRTLLLEALQILRKNRSPRTRNYAGLEEIYLELKDLNRRGVHVEGE